MAIRAATPEDAKAIARVKIDTWRATYRGIVPDKVLDNFSHKDTADRWRQVINVTEEKSTCVFVGSIDDCITGYATGGPERTGDTDFDGELYAVYVHPDQQRQGLGRLLVQHVADHLLVTNRQSMLVWVLSDNPYRSFYEVLGGKIVRERRISVGGVSLPETGYGWTDIKPLASQNSA